MDNIVKLKFKAMPGWESYSCRVVSFERGGQVREVPAAVAEELTKTRPANFEIVSESPPADPGGSLPPPTGADAGGEEDPNKAAVPSETKIVVPGETKAPEEPPPAAYAGDPSHNSPLAPQQKPGESNKDYTKRLKEWERSRG